MNSVEIIGFGSYAPENVITNDEISKIVDTSDEWISTRSGIRERRISTGENTSDLSIKAALAAMKNTGVSPEELDMIIVATSSPDAYTPSTACLVQAGIGAVNAECFDISAACTGFIYGLRIASQFIKTGEVKTALVIGAEVLSKILNWEDRSTCVLFGDGAGAAIIRLGQENGIISTYTGADGTGKDSLYCPAAPVNNPYISDPKILNNTISMNGKEVFKFAVKVMEKSIEEVLKKSECSIDNIKYIVPHQANIRIIEFAAKRLNLSLDKFYINLDRYGNTSAATIPTALDEMLQRGVLNKGDKVVIVGFGAGLTWGSALIQI
ncbi:MAG: beta-ketoacyl-ACP synthase III [Bacillota bacterium]|nr:beta-ketoacyl-ACP synthase III [Bacillota bacterium]